MPIKDEFLKYDLVVFDLDGTLIESYMGNKDKDYHKWEVLPNRKEVLDLLRRLSIRIGIATNQAGVAFGYIHPFDWRVRLRRVCKEFDLYPRDVRVCFHHPKAPSPWGNKLGCERRKPHPTMIYELMDMHAITNTDKVIYVGDMDSDRETARNAGVAYADAKEFFGA